MTTPADLLLTELRRQAEVAGKSRLERLALWEAFATALPEESGGSEARPRLVALLDQLADAGDLALPRSQKAYDWSARPPFPEHVVLARATRSTGVGEGGRVGPDPRSVPWAPELAFVTKIGRLGEDTWADLQRIQRFFAEGGRQRLAVPLRERSLQIFGDEKHLEKIGRGALFGVGKLSYERLRCFSVAPPLVWDPGCGKTGQPVLVIENHHTYFSFFVWNRDHGAYSAVAYGAGNAFVGSVEFLRDLLPQVGAALSVEYFGDLDPEGLRIAVRASEVALRAGLPPVRPAARWYELLLDLGDRFPLPLPAADEPCVLEPKLADWLPPALRERVAALFAAGQRLPQEMLGWEVLQKLEGPPPSA